MRSFNIVQAYIILFIIVLTTITIAQQSNNNAFVFNGESSQIHIADGLAPNPLDGAVNLDANQYAFQYFNKENSENNSISVQAWVYLIGESPDKTMPIIYRSTVNGGESFSLSIENNFAKFSIGGTGGEFISTGPIPAFTWVQLTGTYDGEIMKLYFGKDLAASGSHTLLELDRYTTGEGLYIGKSGTDAFKSLIDEIRLWNIALGENDINGSGGNGNPAEPFPTSLAQYSIGQWSFNEIGDYSGTDILEDYSDSLNHLRVDSITEIVNSKHLPFFVVKSIGDDGDADPGDGNATSLNGQVTLRSAIEEANALAGQQTIYFYIEGTDPIIQPLSELPEITETLSLNAYTQKGYVGLPIIELDGSLITDLNIDGLSITSGGITIKDFVINSFSGYGLSLTSGDENIVQNNYFGTDLTGNSGLPNASGGIFIGGGSSSNTIGGSAAGQGNLIFGNGGY